MRRGSRGRAARGRLALALALVLVAPAGCGGARPPGATVLRLAGADPAGMAHDPAVALFARRVASLSGGRLRVALDERWAAGGAAHEAGLLRAVARGAADLGWAHTRTFAAAGVRAFDALDVPMLVDGLPLEAAVLRGPLGARMLAGARAAGVEGLALLAGPLAHPVGTRTPLRVPGDVSGLAFGLRRSPVADAGVRALGARPRGLGYDDVTLLYTDVRNRPAPPAALEDDLDSVFFDRFGGSCAVRLPGCGTSSPWVTLDVALWPRAAVLVANPRRLRALTAAERAWLSSAAAQAARHAARAADPDRRLIGELCAAGVRFTVASPPARARLRRALAPLYATLARRPGLGLAIRRIAALRARLPAPAARTIPPRCDRRPHPLGPAHGVPSPLPDGVYRLRFTAADVRAAGEAGQGNTPGTVTLTLRHGAWRMAITEPGHYTEHGTYAGTPLRTAWVTVPPGQRDEAFASVAVDRGGGLRFHFVRAGDLPFAQAVYAAHRWRRIGG